MSSNKKQNITTTVDDFEPLNLAFTELTENERAKNQLIAYPRYKHKTMGDVQLKLQFPWMKLFTYGTPKEGEYYKTDKDRAHFKVPFDTTSADVKKLVDKLTAIDNSMRSEEMKKKLFPGKKLDKYQYVPLVKVPAPKDDEDEDTNQGPLNMKVRLNTTWPDIKVLTEVFVSTPKGDGKFDRVKQDISTIDEFSNIVRYRSTYRAIIEPVKLWADSKPKMGMDKLQYGIIVRLAKVEVEPSEGSNDVSKNSDFVDDDDDYTPVTKESSKSVLPLLQQLTKKSGNLDEDEEEEEVVEKKTSKTKDEDEDDDEEEDEDEEDEPEPEPEPPKKQSKTKAPVATKKSKSSAK
jgi:hypothetical protein